MIDQWTGNVCLLLIIKMSSTGLIDFNANYVNSDIINVNKNWQWSYLYSWLHK